MDEKTELMDKYKSLISKGDDEALFQAFDIVINLQNTSLLESFFESYRSHLYKLDPILFIGKHISYYLVSDDPKTALDVLRKYQDAPFISLDVEDFMKELEEEIKKNYFLSSKKEYEFEQVQKDFYSFNEDRIIRAIKFLNECNIRKYISFIKELLLSELEYRFKILILFILIEQKVDYYFEVIDDDKEQFEFNPQNEKLPFQKNKYLEGIKYLDNLNESPSVIDTAKEMLNITEVRMFPKSILDDNDIYAVCEVLVYIAKKSLHEKCSVEKVSFDSHLTLDEINNIATIINQYLN